MKYIQFHRFINRGFLIGPYCPIYGSGVVAVTVLVGGIIGYHGSIAETFFAGFVICGLLEYFVSWYMEKMFHARWWDYSQKPMNLNGRIWIGNLILFGVGSVLIIKVIDPLLFELLAKWSDVALIATAVSIVVLLMTDNIVSHLLMNIVKKEIDSSEADDSEEVSRKVRELLLNHKLLVRRIRDAYPNLQARPHHLTEQLKTAKREMKAATKRAKAEWKAVAGNAKEELEIAAGDIRQEVEKVRENSAKERELRLEHSKMELEAARKKLEEIQEKFAVHKR